ncbi:bifunctional phosphopantothenoylcysteine decarboxylase/phosphopantothenate--cysteine ligase CoaBC [Zavarzinia compransoris]|uniref:Coenzyme A biosynthesis bifunctional protein CoaBC n=1 Tax=Zavarzinia compransoris TaxID=1264899 RepID=A0A317E6H1_9PROT|nr:bifunctional phosphopantothenoylcysteine decarboxylase/phosphopantothenate--cysteine ligase CoaBC [Zavarzinia compransoris]PWR20635.1 bifunctional phosphopantothenoylcysteine decarboxylase/phosphopantothenate--cysteine ligase CoaBC [Zavarzinia compransoris]TDP44548.1 phosphopantothenoylcysteine decarboxylase/phosphopantothenate--cysteine ligase [Zavarzinia compransoris]
MADKRILLVVGGGIAAYKSLELIRRLRERGIAVRAILTRAAQHFVTPLSVSALTGDKAYVDLFSLTDEAEMGHIQLSRDADLLVVAPATADLMAKMANGHADDLATTALLATDKPVLIAPAMNVRMWNHLATRRNHARLIADGVTVIGPNDGDMACGEYGPGRMAEPHEILAGIEAFYQSRGDRPLLGKRIVVTSGPTHEPIDPVRYIANRSSGQQGHALAAALAKLGAQVTLISGPVTLADPAGVETRHVETARQMAAAVDAALPADIAVCAAAVADWRVAGEADQKIKKDGSGRVPALSFVENPDILATISRPGPRRPALVVGFAAETEKVVDHAKAKLARKGCDWIIANDVGSGPDGGVMGAADNTIHIVTAEGTESWPRLPKTEVASRLAARIAQTVKERNI